MPIIELYSKEELYYILTHYDKIIMYFYVNWRVDCNRFDYTFIRESRKRKNIGVVFCKINCDIFSDIQMLFNVNVRKTPVIVFVKNKLIKKYLIGNYPERFEDTCVDFVG